MGMRGRARGLAFQAILAFAVARPVRWGADGSGGCVLSPWYKYVRMFCCRGQVVRRMREATAAAVQTSG